MTEKTQSYLYDLNTVAKELSACLITYVFRDEDPNNILMANIRQAQKFQSNQPLIDEHISEFTKDLEKLLFKLVLSIVENSVHPVIRLSKKTHFELVQDFCKPWHINPTVLHNAIVTISSYRYIAMSVEELMSNNNFCVWSFKKIKGTYLLQEIGDFRIIQWESEHILDGKYYPNVLSTNTSDEEPNVATMYKSILKSIPTANLSSGTMKIRVKDGVVGNYNTYVFKESTQDELRAKALQDDWEEKTIHDW